MKFGVGDKITIREDIANLGENGNFENGVGYSDEMARYAGMTLTVAEIGKSSNGCIYYNCREDGGEWYWSEDMLDLSKANNAKEERPMFEHKAVTQIDREQMIEEMYETLEICDIYHPTDNGLNTILDEWEKQKGKSDIWNGMSALDVLSQHPDYVPEKGYIVKKNEYDRGINKSVIEDVLSNIEHITENPSNYDLLEEVEVRPWGFNEMLGYIEKLTLILNGLGRDADNMTWKGMSYDDVLKEKEVWEKRCNILREEYFIEWGHCYSRESKEELGRLSELIRKIKNWANNVIEKMSEEELLQPLLITDEVVKLIEESELTIRGIRAGQKLNKVIIKILTETKVKDRWVNFNRETARLGDAASPVKFTRFTILSANPIDYWRMSFGSSWKSCQTIDKLGNYRPSDGGDGYEGMHASGTESYMLDPSTLIMYTVDKSYTGNDYELEPKINRCLFHLGEGKFVMGRVYPQGTDGESEVYRQWRQIFQTIIAECMNVSNYWKTEKDFDRKREQYYSYGTHYRDYECGYCETAGWSYLKPNADTIPSDRRIIIGHDPICPSCGSTHYEDDSIECEDCRSDEVVCKHCGYSGNREDMIQIDGEWYCTDCCFYCEYHEQYEVGDDYYYVEGYGNVCYDAIEYSGDFIYCDNCGQYYYCENICSIETEDGSIFCCEDCAERAGYVYIESEDRWYNEEDVRYCNVCETYVHVDDYNEDHDMCNECWQNREEDAEEEIA